MPCLRAAKGRGKEKEARGEKEATREVKGAKGGNHIPQPLLRDSASIAAGQDTGKTTVLC